MLVSLYKHLKRGETGLRANCLPNILEQELQRNPFDGFFYPPNHNPIGVLIGSTQVKFRATLPQNIHMKEHDFFYCDFSLKTNKLPRSFIAVVQSKTYSVFLCTGRVCDFDVFQIPGYLVNAFNTQVSEKLTTTLHF